MLIRNAEERDFRSCLSIAQRAWHDVERPAIYHLFCKFFNNTCFVCEREGHVDAFLLGFISQVDPNDAYIHWIVVDRPARKQGLATRLYEEFFETAKCLGAKRVRLTVSPTNTASLAFHKNAGFEPDLFGETIEVNGVLAVRDYNGPEIHMVPFTRSLLQVGPASPARTPKELIPDRSTPT
jgi:predicted GNAT superfamily acetyltransferase